MHPNFSNKDHFPLKVFGSIVLVLFIGFINHINLRYDIVHTAGLERYVKQTLAYSAFILPIFFLYYANKAKNKEIESRSKTIKTLNIIGRFIIYPIGYLIAVGLTLGIVIGGSLHSYVDSYTISKIDEELITKRPVISKTERFNHGKKYIIETDFEGHDIEIRTDSVHYSSLAVSDSITVKVYKTYDGSILTAKDDVLIK